MDKKITLTEFMKFMKIAEMQYPNAEVVSLGTSFRDGEWFNAIILKNGKEEIVYKIPMYLEDMEKTN